MNILIVGATGATGQLLVKQLLDREHTVKVIVRTPERLPAAIRQHAHVTVIQANLLALSDAELANHVQGSDAVASCLGHNMTLKGVYGQPRRLVTAATSRLCNAIKANQPATPTKFVLMNTVGNRNRDCHEPIALAQQMVIGLLRLLLPPHADNEAAADYLRTKIGQNDGTIKWVVVRPDSLLDETAVTAYAVYPSPIRSAIFDPGRTSRINVAHLMADLITDDMIWQRWQGQMPVIYNRL